MSLNLASAIYTRYRTTGNKAVYIGPGHSDVNKRELVISSVSPKATSTSYGNRRSEASFIDTQVVESPDTTTLRRDLKVGVVTSIPVGSDYVEFEARCAELAALLTDATILKNLFVDGQIEIDKV